MAKIAYDKYYTPPITARWCIDKVKEIIGEDNITEWVEPSAGSGSFSHQIKGCKAYDLYPQHEYIEQADFETLDMGGYKKGRCFIGNPPFGGGDGKLLSLFYNKACDNGDYIAYIQPASFYNSYSKHKKFEIVYSCIIETPYTNENLKTSFTIYKRNPDKDRFENTDYTIPFIKYTVYQRGNKVKYKTVKNHDYTFINYGHLLKPADPYQYVSVAGIDVNNDKYKNEVIKMLKWLFEYNNKHKILQRTHISSAPINFNTLNKIIRICIPELDDEYKINIK
jgi:hypothetical protein